MKEKGIIDWDKIEGTSKAKKRVRARKRTRKGKGKGHKSLTDTGYSKILS